MIKGTPKASGIAISDITCIASTETWHIEGTVRFIDTELGSTHSSCKRQGPWSPETHEKLKELVVQMEKDASRALLKNSVTDKEDDKGLDLGDVEGLGEHIGQESI